MARKIQGEEMKNFRLILALGLVLLFACGGTVPAQEITINGAGASFPYPLYAQWAYKYNQLTGVKLNYQSIGSGGGIAQIKAGTVAFGASDAPLKPEELNEGGLVQFPMIIGGVVPVINLSGVDPGRLKLTPALLADIFLGNITKWNDAAILQVNQGLKLPDKAITVVHRADGSGTTWIFTDYLSKVSPAWSKKVGVGKSVAWPAGIGGKGNEGVANYVQRAAGAIGYVEYAYVVQNKLTYALLQNVSGKFVAPTIQSFQAAAAGADWKNAPGFYMVLTNQPGSESWPITGASFILVHQQQANPATGKAMLKFFDWCYKQGTDIAEQLHYVPIPMNVVELVENAWHEKITSNGQPLWP
jgi:phosphate transport system substrate-binding protein